MDSERRQPSREPTRPKGRFSGRWRILLGALVLTPLLYFVFRGFSYTRFVAVVKHADIRYVLLIPATILVEQLARAWKWRQVLSPLTDIGTTRLFRALMAGYVPGLVVGLGTSVLSRAWLVTRRDGRLTTSAVIATVAVDRLIDSIAFAFFVALALFTTTLPDSAAALRTGLAWGGLASFLITSALLFALFRNERWVSRFQRWLEKHLPRRWGDKCSRFIQSFIRGILLPDAVWRRGIIVVAALVIKLLAVAQFLWAGLAIGIVLPAPDYFFIMVFLGLWVLVGFVIQIPGSSILATVFVLGLFAISREQALAMTLMVGGAFLFSYGVVGALALWLEGIGLRHLKSGSTGS